MSQKRFKQKLSEQLRSIETSCAAYDRGLEHEANRLAVSLRVLFHDTKSSISLMTHLGAKGVTLLSSGVGYNDWKDYVKIVLDLSSPTPIRCSPKLGNKFVQVSFHDWWREQIVHRFKSRDYHRFNLVLSASNQDGGAHVDEKVDQFYENLASGMSVISIDAKNLTFRNEAPYDQTEQQRAPNAHLAMIRQFAHEVLASATHFRWLSRLGGTL